MGEFITKEKKKRKMSKIVNHSNRKIREIRGENSLNHVINLMRWAVCYRHYRRSSVLIKCYIRQLQNLISEKVYMLELSQGVFRQDNHNFLIHYLVPAFWIN